MITRRSEDTRIEAVFYRLSGNDSYHRRQQLVCLRHGDAVAVVGEAVACGLC